MLLNASLIAVSVVALGMAMSRHLPTGSTFRRGCGVVTSRACMRMSYAISKFEFGIWAREPFHENETAEAIRYY
eukprot:scaffold22293_cov31-Tisochrysis_lutea.AAC.5